MTATLLALHDKIYRMQRKRESLRQMLERNHTYYKKVNPDLVTPQVERRYREVKATLDNTNTIDHHILKWTRQELLDHVYPGFKPPGRKQYDPVERAFYDVKIDAQDEARNYILRSKVMLELYEKHKAGYYFLFNTLTVAPEHYKRIEADGREEIRQYTRGFSRSRGYGHNTYILVWEHGEKTGRLHYHVLHAVKEMPHRDPNVGYSEPLRRSIQDVARFWKYGSSLCLPVRYIGDRYSQIGWKYETQNGEGIQLKPIEAIGHYIAKYITKEDKQCPPKIRRRMSRGFGMTMIRNLIQTLTPLQKALLLTENQRFTSTIIMPQSLLRNEAMRSILKDVSTESLNALRQDIEPQQNMLQRLTDSIPQKPALNLQNFGLSTTPISKATAIYDLRQKIKAIEDEINATRITHAGYHVF
jgi:hypothetical protein